MKQQKRRTQIVYGAKQKKKPKQREKSADNFICSKR